MHLIFLVLLALLLPFSLCLSDAHGELGPPQICRCYKVAPSCAPQSPTASPIPTLSPDAPCSSTSAACPLDYTCTCGGFCKRAVNRVISFVTDDDAEVFTCDGTKIGSTAKFDDLQTVTLQEGCDTLYFKVNNIDRSCAIAVTVQVDGAVWGTTDDSGTYTKAGVGALKAVVTYDPDSQGDWTKGNADFSNWLPGVVVETLLNQGNNLQTLISAGSWPVGVYSGEVGSGVYGYKITASYC